MASLLILIIAIFFGGLAFIRMLIRIGWFVFRLIFSTIGLGIIIILLFAVFIGGGL